MIELQAHGVGKAYIPGVWVVREISIRLGAGEALAIVGPNGVGKSTLLKLLCGLSEPTSGQVVLSLFGRRYRPQECLWWAIGVVAPFVQLYGEFTPWELLRMSMRLRGLRWQSEEAGWLLQQLGLEAVASRRIAVLSSGMQQRVRIALAYLHQPVVLALDEVTVTLDAAGIAAVEQLVRWHRERGGIVLAATNSEHERHWSSKVLELPGGSCL